MLRDADLVENARVIMEKPFGDDLETARAAQRLRALDVRRVADLPHRPLPRQGGGAEHPRVPLRERALRADLEPQLHRPHPDRHPRDARAGPAGELLRGHRRLQGHGGHPPHAGDGVRRDGAADGAGAARDQRGEEQGLPLDAADRPVRGGPRPVHAATATSRAWRRDSDTETFIALQVGLDNWRWAGMPFYLRTGKKMAEGMRIISIAFKEAPRTMFPADSGVGQAGPGPPDVRPRRELPGVAVVLRQAAGARDAAGEAVDAVRHRRRPTGRATSWRPTSG